MGRAKELQAAALVPCPRPGPVIQQSQRALMYLLFKGFFILTFQNRPALDQMHTVFNPYKHTYEHTL
jgi:hypothetical protein